MMMMIMCLIPSRTGRLPRHIYLYFATVPQGCVYRDYSPMGSEVAHSIRILYTFKRNMLSI